MRAWRTSRWRSIRGCTATRRRRGSPPCSTPSASASGSAAASPPAARTCWSPPARPAAWERSPGRSSRPATRCCCSPPTGRSSPASSSRSTARPVDVPFFGAVDSPETAVEAVEALATERTVALYLNTPSNPTGQVIPRPWIEALVEWARRRDLWLIADEVYEDYAFAGEHAYTRPLAPERTFAAHSFSKAFGMAGNRCGYVAGPAAAMTELRKIGLHSFYSTPTAAQLAALRRPFGARRPLDRRGPPPVRRDRRQVRRPPGPRPSRRQHLPVPRRRRPARRARPRRLPRGLRRARPVRRPRTELRPLPHPRAALLHGFAAGRGGARGGGPGPGPGPIAHR